MKKILLILCLGFLLSDTYAAPNTKSLPHKKGVKKGAVNNKKPKLNPSRNIEASVGLEVSFKKGVREWAPDGHSADCIGRRHVCEFKIKVDLPLSMDAASVGTLAPGIGVIGNDGGKIQLVMPLSTLQDAENSLMFEGDMFMISADQVFTTGEREALGAGAPDKISAGAYPYSITNGIISINLN